MSGFVFVADVHLDTRGFREDIPGEDGFTAFNAVVDYALAKGKPLVIGGDLFDKNRPPANVVHKAGEIISRHPEVYAVQGNHDLDRTTPWYGLWSNVKQLSLTPQNVGGHMLCGLDYAPMDTIKARLMDVPPCDGLVLHQALRQALGFEGAWNCDLDWINPSITTNLWVGDIHAKNEHYSSDKLVRGVYPGATYPQSISQRDSGYFLDVGTEKVGTHYAFSYQRSPQRPVILTAFYDAGELGDIRSKPELKTIPGDHLGVASLKAPVVYVTYPRDLQGVEAQVRDCLGECYVVSNVLASRNDVGTLRTYAKSSSQLTLEDAIQNIEADPRAKHLAIELARCSSPSAMRDLIKVHREEFVKSLKGSL